jgi:type IV secretion system protein VirB8
MLSIVAVAASILFVKNMMSSKSLEPYVIEIDEKTGIATTVQQPSSTNYTANEVMKRYFVNKFIQSSMSYSPKTYKQDVEITRLFSSPSIYNEFKKRIDPNLLGGNSSIETKVKSLLFKGPNELEIRVAREIQSPGTQDQVKNEIIFMTFFFAPDISLSMEERLINPLGFQVIKFEIGEEVYSY